jgi:hypothetical protein
MIQRSKANCLILVLASLVLVIVFYITYYLRNISNTYYFESYIPAICTEEIPISACGDAVVNVQSVTGDDTEFKYNGQIEPRVIGASNIYSIAKYTEIQITTSIPYNSLVKIGVIKGTLGF